MADDLKARVCEAMGLTVEEVDEFDRVLRTMGDDPDQRAKERADYVDYIRAMSEMLVDQFSVALGGV